MGKRVLQTISSNPKKAVILLSGGIDSATTLALAESEGYVTYALSFDYSQRHKRELESARMLASSLGVKDHLVIRFDMREIGGSALTSEIPIPQKGTENQSGGKHKERKQKAHDPLSSSTHPLSQIPVTYVPARNTIFLSFALGWAEVLEAADIFIGANAVDYSGYPDCRPEYIQSFEDMANLATKASVEGKLRFAIHAPLIAMKKSEIIRQGSALGLDYSLTWSCYDPQLNEDQYLIPCGRCDSCLFRAKGFQEAGIPDPLLIQ
jgi:7-cyano-7-deazaguanine synthase